MRTSTKRAPALGVSALLLALVCALTLPSNAVEAAPTISGAPKTTFGGSSWYSFQPTATDPAVKQSTLRFAIVNKPAWARFSVYTGRLEGATPSTGGTWSNIRISVRSATGSASLPAFSLQVRKAGSSGGTTNRAPVLSGTPSTSVTAGNAYSFRPSGSDPDGRALIWSISNRPGWAAFNTTSGALTGTPSVSNVGTYSNIVISASDGTNRTALPAFNIGVNAAGSSSGSATLSWTPPTSNTNGSTLTNLAGYRIYYGTSPSSLTRTVQLSNSSLTRYVIGDLSAATWYFTIRAYTSSGLESANSNTISKIVR